MMKKGIAVPISGLFASVAFAAASAGEKSTGRSGESRKSSCENGKGNSGCSSSCQGSHCWKSISEKMIFIDGKRWDKKLTFFYGKFIRRKFYGFIFQEYVANSFLFSYWVFRFSWLFWKMHWISFIYWKKAINIARTRSIWEKAGFYRKTKVE